MISREETHRLAPGITATVHDETTPYAYSNIFNVRLRIRVRWEEGAAYETTLEKLGVYEQDLPAVRSELWHGFEQRTVPYLCHPDFPARLRQHQCEERRKNALKVVRYQ